MTSARRYVSHPTRCDVLLYPPSVSPPANDPACSNNTPGTTANTFTLGAGPTAGFMVGYGTGRLRFEMEYLNASRGSAESPIGGTTSTALLSKTSEWSTEEPPFEWIGDYRAHQVCANMYYDVLNSRWTPFAGAGIGWAATGLNYDLQFIRKPEAEYLQIEFDPDWPNVAKRAAAGTASILDTYAGTTRYRAHQVCANMYYDVLNDSRWTPFAGAGIGWAATGLNYDLQFIRKPEAEYLQIEFDPDWPNVAKRAAAGTASILDTYAGTTVGALRIPSARRGRLRAERTHGPRRRATLDPVRRYRPRGGVQRRSQPRGRTRRRRDAVQQRAEVLRHRLSGTDRQPEVPLLHEQRVQPAAGGWSADISDDEVLREWLALNDGGTVRG